MEKHQEARVTELLTYEDKMSEIESAHYGKKEKWFVVTIAPEHNTHPHALMRWAKEFCERTPIEESLWSIEQKGTTPEEMGQHPHIHMAFKRKFDSKAWRSKGEVLRDALSTAKRCGIKIADNCCDVKADVADGRDWFTKYCINYESKDGHKAPTETVDALWRASFGARAYYDSRPPAADAAAEMVP